MEGGQRIWPFVFFTGFGHHRKRATKNEFSSSLVARGDVLEWH
jgi:hypothetical protein